MDTVDDFLHRKQGNGEICQMRPQLDKHSLDKSVVESAGSENGIEVRKGWEIKIATGILLKV